MSQRDRQLLESFVQSLLAEEPETIKNHRLSESKLRMPMLDERRPADAVVADTRRASAVQSEPLKLKVAQTLLQDALLRNGRQQRTGPAEAGTDVSEKSDGHDDNTSRPNVHVRPAWAKGDIQTLIFRLGALRLAVPMVKLGGIQKMSDRPVRLAGQPDWYLGLMSTSHGDIAVVDTGLWLMPERYREDKGSNVPHNYVVVMDDSAWGLACSDVENARTVHENEVQWNDRRVRRPWMAGILKNEMCALLDVDVLIQSLNDGQSAFFSER